MKGNSEYNKTAWILPTCPQQGQLGVFPDLREVPKHDNFTEVLS